jgi:hypothetical protein
MVFNSIDPCQEFVFDSDVIKRVKTFKYLGILLETTPNLDSAVEHLAIANRCSLFALNRSCVKLCIMDVKLWCDLFNTLVCSTTNYAYEVWVDSKKIEAIKVVYRGFFKSLLEVRKKTSMSIMLVEFGKFPFEHFAWDKCCCIIIMWAWSLKIASWEKHGKPSLLCLLWERNVGLNSWKNGYSRISPMRW